MVESETSESPFLFKLSLERLITELRNRPLQDLNEENLKLLKELKGYPELTEGITDLKQTEAAKGVISKLLAPLFPGALSGNEIKAVSLPYQRLIFNHSDRFRKIIDAAGGSFELTIRNFDDHQFYILGCCLILNRHYNAKVDFSKPLFCDIPTAKGTLKHYKILYNADFIDIFPTRDIPLLNEKHIRYLLDNYHDITAWKKAFPVGSWTMKGFAIISLVDVTTENAVSILKDNLIGNFNESNIRKTLESIFSSIFGIPGLRVGLVLFDALGKRMHSGSLGRDLKPVVMESIVYENREALPEKQEYHNLLGNDSYFTIPDTDLFFIDQPDNPVGQSLRKTGVRSYILAPIEKLGETLGFLEVASITPNAFNSVNANKLEQILPFLTDTINIRISEFKNRVQAVIQTNYTALHPSVNWKFEREAHNFIQTADLGEDYALQEIRFKNVFGLYGQTDIQNSSATRNLSVQQDLVLQMRSVIALLSEIDRSGGPDIIGMAISTLKSHLRETETALRADTEQNLGNYLESVVNLLLFSKKNAAEDQFSRDVAAYLTHTNRENGAFYNQRRAYDQTITQINLNLTEILDKRHQEIQDYFPHYFERFKTDGVDYNLYAGESIFPGHGFGQHIIKRLRIWQLLITIEMETAHRRLMPELAYGLPVTSLILSYNTAIDIRFRMDERHFDLDGAYSIRYEIIKKRIDKAHIKDTAERITQAKKITVVYSKPEEKSEYLEYFIILKNMDLVSARYEDLDIEDLQGISGLRALRFEIITEVDLLENFSELYEKSYENYTYRPT